MIIKSPTANYIPILPTYSDAGSITYTISNNQPPRKSSVATIMPVGVTTQSKITRITPKGKLVITSNGGYSSIAQSSNRQYNVGDVLEFEYVETQNEQRQIFEPVETRYDLDVIDYKKIGLSDEDIALMSSVGSSENQKIRDDLNSVNIQYSDTKVQISSAQSDINSIDKTLRALALVSDQSSVSSIIDKLNSNRQVLTDKLLALNAQLTELYDEMVELTNKARNIGVIVK